MSKTCILCPNRIQTMYKLCRVCYKEYHQYTDTPWFKELVKMQIKQDRIDSLENGDIDMHGSVAIDGLPEKPSITVKREIGRPKTDWRIVQRVLDIYDDDREKVIQGKKVKPLSLRAIAREIDNAVGYFTVRTILLEYRPDYNKR
jgi:hypothetical protein